MNIGASVIAVSIDEFRQFGCPHCGYRSGFGNMSGGGATVWICGDRDCDRTSVILANGVVISPFSFGGHHPTLQSHPRYGIPKHGTPDKKPKSGGEFFSSRGVGFDETPGCFVCGGDDGFHHNIAAFVWCKKAGERVVRRFPHGARLDYRTYEPDRVQVKIGACDIHLSNLKMLEFLTRHGIITRKHIEQSINKK